MPRRPALRVTAVEEPAPDVTVSVVDPIADNFRALRTHWKWAAFSQFFTTFAPMFNMPDVSLNDIEDDLARGSALVIPRIMQRLLFVLTYDRRITPESWQSSLRRQYYKRDPFVNPIGPDPNDTLRGLFSSLNTTSNTPDPSSDQPVKTETLDPSFGEPNITREPTPATREPSITDDEFKAEQAQDGDMDEDEDYQPKRKPIQLFVTDEQAAELSKQETKDWFQLSTLEKLESLHLVTEWLFQNSTRLRTMMRSDDDGVSWRAEPIGYDAKRNAYWLIGPDRLWIQREPPKPPRVTSNKSLKRKREEKKSAKGKGKQTVPASKRRRLQKDTKKDTKKGKAAEKVTIKVPAQKATDSPITNGRGRAAKAQAKEKLDQQAKQLAEFNRQAAELTKRQNTRGKRGAAASSPTSLRPAGTRVSARLRGSAKQEDEEWQVVPDEWLQDKSEDEYQAPEEALKTGLESDDDNMSDLTQLSDDEEEEEEEEEPEPEPEPEVKEEPEDERYNVHADPSVAPWIPEGFIQWELICHSLNDWEHVLELWENATHYSEKALYKYLKNEVVPFVVAELKEAERKKKIEELVVHRKRSSRIATKETEKEEARLTAIRKAEEEEKLGRARRAEARQLKEEQERLKRENAREQRRKEREAAQEAAEQAKLEAERKAAEPSPPPKPKQVHAKPTANGSSKRGGQSKSRAHKKDNWELDCEICYRKGQNVDDGVPIACCESCGKWQHIPCHDRADQVAGKPKRNWDTTEFVCRQCHFKKLLTRSSGYQQSSSQGGQNPYLQTMRMAGPVVSPYTAGQMNYGAVAGTMQPYGPAFATPTTPSPAAQTTAYGSPSTPKPISFQHYEPQRRGFTTAGASPATPNIAQNYNQLVAASGQYAAPMVSPQYPRPVAGSGWSVTGPPTDSRAGYHPPVPSGSGQVQWPAPPGQQSGQPNLNGFAYSYQTQTPAS